MPFFTDRAVNLAEATQIDDVGGGVSYIGKATEGSATSSAVWRIQRLTELANDLSIEWADGNSLYDNIWDNRLSLNYS